MKWRQLQKMVGKKFSKSECSKIRGFRLIKSLVCLKNRSMWLKHMECSNGRDYGSRTFSTSCALMRRLTFVHKTPLLDSSTQPSASSWADIQKAFYLGSFTKFITENHSATKPEFGNAFCLADKNHVYKMSNIIIVSFCS